VSGRAILYAISSLRGAHEAFVTHGLLLKDECVVCRRMIDDGGVHAEDCAVDRLRLAAQNLEEFRQEIIG
jgi:hypothetical protein